MGTTKLLDKVGKKYFRKNGLLGNQKPEPKFSGTRISVTRKFRFGYGSPFCRPEISGTRTEISFGSGTRTMNTANSRVKLQEFRL